jgi:hypothetical protein
VKVVVCRECGDWMKLTGRLRSCSCRRSRGLYLPDGIQARVIGPCIVVAIKNSEFPHKGEGTWTVLDPKDPESHVEVEG